MFGIGVPELILILAVGLIVFGPGKLPEMGRMLGKGIREFRKASNALTQAINTPEPPPAPVQAQPAAQQPAQPVPTAEERPAPATTESAATAVAAHRAQQEENSVEQPAAAAETVQKNG